MCIRWKDAKGHQHWCATKDGAKPSEDAIHDRTECDHTVHLRIGSEKCVPTCLDCIVIVSRKQLAK